MLDIEERWTSLLTYDTGTWAEFKEQVIKQYPELGTVKEGTLSRIEEIVSEYRGQTFESGNKVSKYI